MARRKSTTTETAPKATQAEDQGREDRITLVGRLCADPVLRHTKSGKAVTTIRIAVNVPDSESSFHSVVVWNRIAEVVCQFMRKGRKVEVVGWPRERSYEAADGTQRTVAEISAYSVEFLPRRKTSESSAPEKEVA